MQPNMTSTALRPAARIMRWPALVSMLLAVALMVSSLHHVSCVDDDGPIGGSVGSFFVGMDKSAPPFDADQCLPGHCHCACHGSAQASFRSASTLAPLAGVRIGMREDRLPPADAGSPPFKPPRA